MRSNKQLWVAGGCILSTILLIGTVIASLSDQKRGSFSIAQLISPVIRWAAEDNSASASNEAAQSLVLANPRAVEDTPQPEPSRALELQSQSSEYHVTINGILECGEEPCPTATNITLSIDTRHYNLEEVVHPSAEGHFAAVFNFKGQPSQQVDWQMDAQLLSRHASASGRFILQDDQDIHVQQTLTLP